MARRPWRSALTLSRLASRRRAAPVRPISSSRTCACSISSPAALTQTDIAICGDTVVGTYGAYRGAREIDGRGRIVVPGFIDTHLHVESSLVTPLEFDACVLPHGVTTAICDPHEMANVLGTAAFDYFLACGRRTSPWICACSYRAAFRRPHLETSGARIEAEDLRRYRGHPQGHRPRRVHELSRRARRRSRAASPRSRPFPDGHIDGHAPLVRGHDLNGYLAAGIRTDHETTSAEEALEKIRKGMTVLIREGSVSKDLQPCSRSLTSRRRRSSPLHRRPQSARHRRGGPSRLHDPRADRGAAAPPLAVYRAASLTAAHAFGLGDRGMIAPGRRADIVLLDDLEACAVSAVIAGGRLVDDELFAARRTVAPIGLDSVKARAVSRRRFPRARRRRRDLGDRRRSRARSSPSISSSTCRSRAASARPIPARTSSRSPSSSGTASTAISGAASSRASA